MTDELVPCRPEIIPEAWSKLQADVYERHPTAGDGTRPFELVVREDFDNKHGTWMGIVCNCCGDRVHCVGDGGRNVHAVSISKFERQHLGGARHTKKWEAFCAAQQPQYFADEGGEQLGRRRRRRVTGTGTATAAAITVTTTTTTAAAAAAAATTTTTPNNISELALPSSSGRKITSFFSPTRGVVPVSHEDMCRSRQFGADSSCWTWGSYETEPPLPSTQWEEVVEEEEDDDGEGSGSGGAGKTTTAGQREKRWTIIVSHHQIWSSCNNTEAEVVHSCTRYTVCIQAYYNIVVVLSTACA